ncbi:SdrD B-like domain-containing protein [Neptunomonas sp. XY-337]|uniref:SdrD B-like domain-containing protein n=1 Tax=Neptunomonas sp. XY-337 TaxID=2561897 RepID=UPI0010A9A4E9|nr:SdrD B-like domain-containing protein [Neptunomonas sp. XY-337]
MSSVKLKPLYFALSAALYVPHGMAVTNTNVVKSLNAASNPIDSGEIFAYNMAWSCPGSVSPADDCLNMRIADTLPEYVQATALPSSDGKLAKVCVQAPLAPLPDFSSCSQPGVSTSSPVAAGSTLHFVFNSRITAGDSGSLTLETRFEPGSTPDGRSVTNDATITAECDSAADPGCSDPAPRTSTSDPITASATDETSIVKSVLSEGAITYDTSYRIRVCPSSDNIGFITPENLVIEDTLPDGANFVSASVAPNSGTGTAGDPLTWEIISLSSCQNIDVVVNYPSGGTNTTGASKTNTATLDYEINSTPATTLSDDAVITLDNPNPSISASKSASDQFVNPNQTMSYTITGRNNGNIPLGMTIADTIPNQCDVTTLDVRNADTYILNIDTNGDGVSDRTDTEADAGSTHTYSSGDITFSVGETLISFSAAFGSAGSPSVPFTGSNSRSVTIACDVINPGIDGSTITMPAPITNTATIDGANGGDVAPQQTPSRTITLRDPAANQTIAPDAIKTQNPSGVITPGNNATFEIAMTNSGNYSSAPEQADLTDPVFADLLPTDMSYVSSTIVGSAPASCATPPDINVINDYNSTGRTLVIWDWTGKSCTLSRGETVTYNLVSTVGPTTPAGSVTNNVAFLGSSNTETRGTEQCSVSGGFVADTLTGTLDGATGTADASQLCHAGSRSFTVQRVTNVISRKAVRGSLDNTWLYNADEPNNVGRTHHEGGVFWRLEVENTANIPLDNIELIDIMPFGPDISPDGTSNTGVGTGAALDSTWDPNFVKDIDLSSAPAGTKVYYTQAINPCRANIVNAAGCNPMTTLPDGTPLSSEAVIPAAGAPGEWSDVLPNIPSRVHAFRIVYPTSYELPPGETLVFEYSQFGIADAPITDCPAAANSSCSNIAWNTFGYSYEEADINLANASAPTRVGIVVQPIPAGTAALGDFVWHDTNEDGVQDNDERSNGINDVLVQLFRDPNGIPNDGDEVLVVDTNTINHPVTGLPGYYHFSGLTPTSGGERYIVRFGIPNGMTGSPQDSTSDGNDSDGAQNGTMFEVTGITLASGEDRLDIDQGYFANPAIFSIGNRVWLDSNADSIDNDGVGNAAESSTGLAGITVELWAADGSGTALATATTNSTGHYLFPNLSAGDYRVVIPAAAKPAGLFASGVSITNAGLQESSPVSGNSDIDVHDHGEEISAPVGNIPANSIVSSTVTLGPLAGEPINEAGTDGPEQTPGYYDFAPDNRSNLSVDFGFYALSVGNQVWFDTDNNGVRDPAELPVVGVTVEVLNPDGSVAGSSVTDANGFWRVDGLPAGSGYRARVTAAAFGVGAPLEGYVSSTWHALSVDLDKDTYDHGLDSDTPEVDGIRTLPFTLSPSNLPTTEVTGSGQGANGSNGDNADNLTVDFGFTLPGTPQTPDSPIKMPPTQIPVMPLWAYGILAGLLGLFGRRKLANR